MGLDDAWAAFSLLAAVVLLVGAWLRSDVDLPLDERVKGYFMLVSCFTCVLWSALPPFCYNRCSQRGLCRSARMSILFSIRRIIPRLMTLRRHADICAVLFLCMWIAVLTQKLYICTHDDAWQHKKNVQCILGESVGGLELAS